MEQTPHPDLGRILPKPLLRQLGAHRLPFSAARASTADAGVEDFLIDVQRRAPATADDPGFGLAQLRAIATRLAARFPAVAHAHRIDAMHAQTLLDRHAR